jgi:hypothetical protein
MAVLKLVYLAAVGVREVKLMLRLPVGQVSVLAAVAAALA